MWHCEMTLILFQTLYLESLEAKEDNGQEVVEGKDSLIRLLASMVWLNDNHLDELNQMVVNGS